MLNKIAKRIILLLFTITVVGVLSGCTQTILSQNGPTAIFVAGKLDSDNTFSKSANWLENAFSKFENLAKHGAEEKSSTFVIPDQYQVLLIGSDRRDGSWNGNAVLACQYIVGDTCRSGFGDRNLVEPEGAWPDDFDFRFEI